MREPHIIVPDGAGPTPAEEERYAKQQLALSINGLVRDLAKPKLDAILSEDHDAGIVNPNTRLRVESIATDATYLATVFHEAMVKNGADVEKAADTLVKMMRVDS